MPESNTSEKNVEKSKKFQLSRQQLETTKEVLGFFLCLATIFFGPFGLLAKAGICLAIFIVLFPAQLLGNLASAFSYYKWHNAAIKIADLGLRIDRLDSYCHFYKIEALILVDKLDEAKNAATIASTLITDYSDMFFSLWRVLYHRAEYGKALELANKIVELFPQEWSGYYARSMTLTCISNSDYRQQMIDDAEKVLKLNKQDDCSLLLSSRVNVVTYKFDDAISDAETAFKKFPTLENRINLAICYMDTYDYPKTNEILEPLTHMKKIPEGVVVCRAIMFAMQDMFDAALRDLEHLKYLHDPSLLFIKGELHRQKNELCKAYKIATDLEKEFPLTMNGPSLKARVLLSLERFDQSLSVLNNCYEVNQYCALTLSAKSLVYLMKEDYSSTIEMADKALAINKYSYQAARHKACAFLGLDNVSEAEKWNEYADEIYCDDSFSWTCHGYLALAKSQEDQALEHFSRAISSNKYDPENYRERAKILEKAGKTEEAQVDQKAYEAIIEKIKEEDKHIPG